MHQRPIGVFLTEIAETEIRLISNLLQIEKPNLNIYCVEISEQFNSF